MICCVGGHLATDLLLLVRMPNVLCCRSTTKLSSLHPFDALYAIDLLLLVIMPNVLCCTSSTKLSSLNPFDVLYVMMLELLFSFGK